MNNVWETIAGHDQVISQLRRATRAERVSHAYLLMGFPGASKTHIARVFAASLLCEAESEHRPCGYCAHCVKCEALAHVDMREVFPDTGSIKISQIRELVMHAYLTPVEARRKVYILHNVEKLTIDAANSLLKLLEDPPGPQVVFVLLADSAEVPSTIISRCQVLRLGQDRQLMNSGNQTLAEDWLLLSVQEQMQRGTNFVKEKADLELFIESLTWCIRDVYYYRLGLKNSLHSARQEVIEQLSRRYGSHELLGKWQFLLYSRRLLDRNVNRRELVDYLFWGLLGGVN